MSRKYTKRIGEARLIASASVAYTGSMNTAIARIAARLSKREYAK